jgi:hypothetical protein
MNSVVERRKEPELLAMNKAQNLHFLQIYPFTQILKISGVSYTDQLCLGHR